jgi:hypothetical protein
MRYLDRLLRVIRDPTELKTSQRPWFAFVIHALAAIGTGIIFYGTPGEASRARVCSVGAELCICHPGGHDEDLDEQVGDICTRAYVSQSRSILFHFFAQEKFLKTFY